jgi:hypothetical protein
MPLVRLGLAGVLFISLTRKMADLPLSSGMAHADFGQRFKPFMNVVF